MRRLRLVLALMCVLAVGCRERAAPRPRLVLLYATCTLNRDHVSPYGGGVTYTPNLAAFARESVTFLRHHSETDQSGPAYASIFSGSQVDRHGIFRHPARLRDELYLAAEAFASQGYETHFWSGHPMASAHLNYGQGVLPQNVHMRRPGQADLYALTGSDAPLTAILERLRRDASYRAYVQVAFTISHAPYTPVDRRAIAMFRREHPEQWPDLTDQQVARWVAFYDANRLRLEWDFPRVVKEHGLDQRAVAELAAVLDAYYKVSVFLLDHCFGRVVDAIRAAGLLDDSLIAFTSDHGETLYRPDALFQWTHGLEAHPDAIQVPLIVKLPAAAGRKGAYEGVSRSMDVFPTLAGLSGFAVGPRQGVDGTDLSAALRGRASPPRQRAYSHTTLLGPELVDQFRGWLVSSYHPSVDKEHMWVAVRDGDLYARLRKLEDGRWGIDVRELGAAGGRAVPYDPRDRRHRDLARDLEAYRSRLLASYGRHQTEQALHEDEVRERLRSLGYIQ
jgi:arylsulfatase A-like enzyme